MLFSFVRLKYSWASVKRFISNILTEQLMRVTLPIEEGILLTHRLDVENICTYNIIERCSNVDSVASMLFLKSDLLTTLLERQLNERFQRFPAVCPI